MIKPGIDNLIKWLQINKIVSWHISTTSNSGQDNTRLFTSDPDQSIDTELERMRQVLELSDNTLVYVFGKTKAESKVGNYMEKWTNTSANVTQDSAAVNQALQAVHGTPSFVSREELDERIHEAVARERFAAKQEAFEREVQRFEAEKKDFDDTKNSMIGIAVEKAMPFIGHLLGLGSNVAVAGTQGNIQAMPITPIQAQQQQQQQPYQEQQAIEELPFTEAEQEQITAVLEQYKNFDADYLDVLTKFVNMAVSGQPVTVGVIKLSYNDIKQFILGA